MEKVLKYEGKVRGGRLILPAHMRDQIVETFDNREIEFIVRRKMRRRSNEQNRYYWGVCVRMIIQGMIDLGNENLSVDNDEHAEAVHEFLKNEILDNGERFFDYEGVERKLQPSTRKLNTSEFEWYLEMVRRWAAEYLNITIPLPNETPFFLDEPHR